MVLTIITEILNLEYGLLHLEDVACSLQDLI
jgi:hypothetical protein